MTTALDALQAVFVHAAFGMPADRAMYSAVADIASALPDVADHPAAQHVRQQIQKANFRLLAATTADDTVAAIEAGAAPDARFGCGCCAKLHSAAREEQCDVMRVLLDAGADPDGCRANDTEYTPLHVAVRNGCTRAADALLRAGADVDATMPCGCNIFHHAVSNIDMLEVVVQHATDVDAVDSRGRTALALAVDANNLDAVELLLENDADPNVGEDPPLWVSLGPFMEDFCEVLLKYGAVPRPEDYTEAASIDALLQLTAMLDAHPLTVEETDRLARIAYDKGHYDIVRMLCDNL